MPPQLLSPPKTSLYILVLFWPALMNLNSNRERCAGFVPPNRLHAGWANIQRQTCARLSSRVQLLKHANNIKQLAVAINAHFSLSCRGVAWRATDMLNTPRKARKQRARYIHYAKRADLFLSPLPTQLLHYKDISS